jgi:hypothetical protein
MQPNNSPSSAAAGRAVRAGESGNVFFLIMIGVVLFAALMFTFSKGARQGGGSISRKAAEVAAIDILDYVQSVERGTQRVLSKECSENDISFYVPTEPSTADFEHSPDSPDKCNVFNSAGGAIGYQSPPPDSGATVWRFSGANAVPGIASTGNDLIIWLPYINESVCDALNARLGAGDTPSQVAGTIDYAGFKGSFSGSGSIHDSAGNLDSRNSGCFRAGTIDHGPNDGGLHFFHVIYAR